jgi:hypothetical protein
MKEELPNLENLSVEDLKTLHKNINLLLKDKCKPKYEKNTYFINPEDLSFIRICYSDNYVDGNLFYRIEISKSDGVTSFRNVEESFIDKCLSISEEIFRSLLDYKHEFFNKIFDFNYKQDIERSDYKESLINEFKDKLQEIIKELNQH